MTRLAAHQVRKDFADTLNRVIYQGERIVIHRRGKNAAVLVPIEDLKLIEAMEDQIDLKLAKKARKEKGSVSLAEVKKKYGL
jgi:prevent-host-death family protein